jgi:hypothetical protein
VQSTADNTATEKTATEKTASEQAARDGSEEKMKDTNNTCETRKETEVALVIAAAAPTTPGRPQGASAKNTDQHLLNE